MGTAEALKDRAGSQNLCLEESPTKPPSKCPTDFAHTHDKNFGVKPLKFGDLFFIASGSLPYLIQTSNSLKPVLFDQSALGSTASG